MKTNFFQQKLVKSKKKQQQQQQTRKNNNKNCSVLWQSNPCKIYAEFFENVCKIIHKKENKK